MKAQFAVAIGSDDVDFDMEKPKEIESLGIDLEKIDSEVEAAAQPPVTESEPAEKTKQVIETVKETKSPEKPKQKEPAKKTVPGEKSDKKEKIRNILMEKVVKWRKAGYDVAPLEDYLEDVEGFKTKAKEVLGDGKTVKLRYLKQLEMWREKGFDVSELEPILDTDIDIFQEKAKEILKKQKK
jgi:hypothetical protein